LTDFIMQSRTRTRNALVAGFTGLIAGGLVGACDIISPDPSTGTLLVTVSTSGQDLDHDGYAVSLRSSAEHATDVDADEHVLVNGQVVFEALPAGMYTVELRLVDSNCVTLEQNPHQVTVIEGETTTTAFQVTCSYAGSLKVKVETCGTNVDPDGYTVWLDGEEMDNVSVDDSSVYPVTPGEHQVWLAGVADNCTVYGLVPRTVDVPWWRTDSTLVAVYCDADELSKIASSTGSYWGNSIQVMSPDGRCRVTVTSGDFNDGRPLWSPDGSRLAFERGGGSGADNRGICVMNADGSGRSCLGEVHDVEVLGIRGFNWSPDGTQIAFSGSIRRPGEISGYDILVVNRDGSELVNLTNTGVSATVEWPTWSPDGSRIAYSAHYDDQWEIYVMNADGTDVRNLTNHAANDLSPAWSPDGSMLAFQSWREDLMGLYVMDVDGTNQVKLSGPVMMSLGQPPVWSPAGDQLAFVSGLEYPPYDPHYLYVVNSDGSGLTTLVAGSGPAWSPDGTRIVFATEYMNIAVINADGTGLIDLGVPGVEPTWSR
jgi:TolB protein